MGITQTSDQYNESATSTVVEMIGKMQLSHCCKFCHAVWARSSVIHRATSPYLPASRAISRLQHSVVEELGVGREAVEDSAARRRLEEDGRRIEHLNMQDGGTVKPTTRTAQATFCLAW